MENSHFDCGDSMSLTRNAYTKDGSSFLGWSTKKDAATAEYKNEEIVINLAKADQTVTLYAVWVHNKIPYTVEIHYQKADGSYELYKKSAEANEGEQLTLIPETDFVVEDGYYLDEIQSVLTNTIKANITYDIYLNRNETSITYDLNADDATIGEITPKTGLWGSIVKLDAPDPERQGYTFRGWSVTPNDSSNIISEAELGKTGTTVYAVWTKNTQRQNNSSSAVKKTSVTIGNVVYKISGSNATVVKASKKSISSVTIKAAVKIGGKTYKVTSISKNAFKGCKKLKKVTIQSKKLTKIGSNAFKGIHKKAVFKVSKSCKSKYKKLLKRAGWKKTMKVK